MTIGELFQCMLKKRAFYSNWFGEWGPLTSELDTVIILYFPVIRGGRVIVIKVQTYKDLRMLTNLVGTLNLGKVEPLKSLNFWFELFKPASMSWILQQTQFNIQDMQ